jgi:formylglycine-generating enzyme required for sulfatase activity
MVVLHVNPDPEARASRAAWLRKLNATLHDAPDAESAVAIAQQLTHLDVLITEGWLDDQFSGFDLRDAVSQRFPVMRTVFTSRYDLTRFQGEFGGCPILYDPVEEQVLLHAVAGPAQTPTVAFPVMAMAHAAAPEPQPEPEPEPPVAPPAGAITQAVIMDDDDAPPVLSPGTVLGSYQIKERLYAEPDTETYLAVQQGIGRKVALVLLRPELVPNGDEVEKFKERERVKAAIEHPRIAPLYEALNIGSHYFYTREMPHGRTIEELQLAGEKFGDKVLVDIVANVSDAMAHATLRGHLYRMLSARDVSVDGEHQASIVNVFRSPGGRVRNHVADVKKFLIMLRTLADGPRARHLLDDLVREGRDWEGLRQRAADLQDEFREHSLLKRADTKEAQDIQAAHQKGPLPPWAYAVGALVVLGLVAGIVWRNRSLLPPPPDPLKEKMVFIKGGDFTFQRDEKRKVPDVWMDQHEVTIGEYAEFLDALEKDKENPKRHDHPEQPADKKDHKPKGWNDYLKAARTAGNFNNQPININCPVARVDWWDAFAYAKWRGNRLPTELEWERAARGVDGRRFPWGNDPKPTGANLGSDYDQSGRGGNKDGFNYWAPVDKMPSDVTAEGVVGLAGNVEEWTSTWDAHPDFPDVQIPITRGGSFALPASGANDVLTARSPQAPDEASYWRGFRTVRDTEPPSDMRAKIAAP